METIWKTSLNMFPEFKLEFPKEHPILSSFEFGENEIQDLISNRPKLSS